MKYVIFDQFHWGSPDHIERGQWNPSARKVEELAEALGVSPAYLLLLSLEENDLPPNKRRLYKNLIKPLIDTVL